MIFARSANVSLNNSRERFGRLREAASKEKHTFPLDRGSLQLEKGDPQAKKGEKERARKLPLRSLSQGIRASSELPSAV
jgi:hypothetical protein